MMTRRLGAVLGLAMALLLGAPVRAQQSTVTQDIQVYGTCYADTIDAVAPGDYLSVGQTNAAGVNVSASGFYTSIAGNLSVAGSLLQSGELATSISSNQNDYAPFGIANATILTVAPTGAGRTITGIAQPSGGASQRLLVRNSATLYTLTLAHQSASSSATSRFVMQGATDLVLDIGETAEFLYLGSRWRLIGKNASSSGAPSGTAAGDLAGTYPNPTVVAVHDGGGTRYTLGTWTDTRILQVSGTSVTSSALGGDVSGTVGSVVVDQARGLRETGGPTTLTVGSVPAGAMLVRSGSTIVGSSLAGSVDVSGTSPALTVTGAHFNGTALAFSNTITDGYLLGRGGSTIAGVPVGATTGVALYDDERFEDLFDTGHQEVTANTGSSDLGGTGIFNGMTGSGGGSNGSNRYGLYRQNITGSVSGNSQTQSNSAADAYLAMGPKIVFKHAVQRTTNIRTFVGYSTATCQPVTADDSAGAAIGFQYSTARGDTSIRMIWDNGTTQGTLATAVSFTADVPLVFVIDWNRASATFTGRIYSTSGTAWTQVFSATQSTGLPADTTNFFICSGAATLTASTVYFRTYRWAAKLRGL